MKQLVLTMSLLSLFFVNAASAEETGMAGEAYFQVDLMQLDMDLDFQVISFNAKPLAIRAKYGKKLNSNLAFEGEFAFGIGDDDFVNIDGTSIGGELKSLFGAYLRAGVNLNPTSEVYGRIGIVAIDIELSASNIFGESFTKSYDDTGIALGGGVSIGMGDKAAIVIEYNLYPDVDIEDGNTIATTSFSIGYQGSF